MKSNPFNYHLYKKNCIETASPVEIIILLYEAAIKNLEMAEEFIDDFKSYDKATTYINKANDIIIELRVSLDFKKGEEIAENLDSLYDFISENIKAALLKKEKKPLLEAVKILKGLLDAWHKLESQNKNNPSNNPLNGFSISG